MNTLTRSNRKCSSKESTFVGGVSPTSWFNPDNWDAVIDIESFRGDMANSPLPHSDRVPCKMDRVIIPYATRLKLTFNSDIRVSSLDIGGFEHTQNSIDGFMMDSIGKLIINNPYKRKLLITNQTCTDPTGCGCGNDKPESLVRICSFYINKCEDRKLSCPKSRQIKPDGFCCPICGTYLSMKYQTRFEYSLLENLIRIFLSSHSVKFYMSKTYSNRIQIVIVDDDNISAMDAAIKLKETLELDNHYRLNDIQLYSSSMSVADTKDYTIYLVISIVSLIAFGITLAVYYRNRLLDNGLIDHLRLSLMRVRSDSVAADFFRFQSEDDKIEMRSDKWTPSESVASSLSDNNAAETFPQKTHLNVPIVELQESEESNVANDQEVPKPEVVQDLLI